MSDPAARLRDRDHVAFAAAAVSALIAILVWTLWALPIARSVADAEPAPVGDTVVVDLSAGERAGIWGSGRSVLLGTVECVVETPSGEDVPQGTAPSLNWNDTLWWLTGDRNVEQFAQFTASEAGAYRVTCTDSLQTYEGLFLVAGDSFGSGAVGLGRGGSADFATGTLLAFGAVVCVPLPVLIVVVIALRRWRDRRRAAASRGSWTARASDPRR